MPLSIRETKKMTIDQRGIGCVLMANEDGAATSVTINAEKKTGTVAMSVNKNGSKTDHGMCADEDGIELSSAERRRRR